MGVEQSSNSRLPTLPPDWRYTIRQISMENRTININKEPYVFKKELGAGAFGCVYSARRVNDGYFFFFSSFHLRFSFVLI